jgi:hypothetical protein
MPSNLPAALLAAAIIEGDAPASDAIGRPDVYPHLSRNPFLGSSAKIDAGQSVGILSTVLYMQPARESGREACAGRSAGCTAACLAEGTGRMSMTGPQRARRRRHGAFYADRAAFLRDLSLEVKRHEVRARKAGKIPAVRLNGTTDLPWHRMPFVDADGTRWPNVHAAHPNVRFYEYTKLPLRVAAKGGLPPNLHLTFSVSDHAEADRHAIDYLSAGYGAAVVLRIARHDIPSTFHFPAPSGVPASAMLRYPTVDGDAHDARFLDPAGSIVVLAAKGRAKSDTSGFVRDPN